jgi:hypothetical protein
MVRTLSAKLKAIRQVTQENRGKQTPGIDGVVCDTPEDNRLLVHQWCHHAYHQRYGYKSGRSLSRMTGERHVRF